MMVCAIHQLHYLPWLRYFDKIARTDVFVVLDNIQYNKNGWQNRNKIKAASGAMVLTVPVHAPLGCTLDAVTIDETQRWRRKHRAAIRQNYARAPFFARHAEFLENAYAREWTALNALNRHMLDYFVRELGIETRTVYASDLNVHGTATERLINLVRAVGADTYYSGAYALDQYLDAAQLEAAGIGLRLQEWCAPEYPQFHAPFVTDLSVLDLIMHCGPRSLDVLLGKART
ncbi:MAG: WbqC family protein [Candidatus Hydrogenedentes bacterium]|nr:WbqC family protein [Candidatus Hydrogenedentota bacterium]